MDNFYGHLLFCGQVNGSVDIAKRALANSRSEKVVASLFVLEVIICGVHLVLKH